MDEFILFTNWWIFWFPVFVHYEYSCFKHLHADLYVNMSSFLLDQAQAFKGNRLSVYMFDSIRLLSESTWEFDKQIDQ